MWDLRGLTECLEQCLNKQPHDEAEDSGQDSRTIPVKHRKGRDPSHYSESVWEWFIDRIHDTPRVSNYSLRHAFNSLRVGFNVQDLDVSRWITI